MLEGYQIIFYELMTIFHEKFNDNIIKLDQNDTWINKYEYININ